MKHKRQTLSKEDGDDKDGASSDGLEKTKSDKSFGLDDEDKKSSCHNCDITSVGGDIGSSLTNDGNTATGGNNNTLSVANNNNNNNNSSGFNANSNGTASSCGSTNSVSSTFEKIMVDEDSRSHDESDVTSPNSSKKLDVRVKIEVDHKSPNPSSKPLIGLSKKSPTKAELCGNNGVLMTLSDSTIAATSNPALTNRSLTPSSTPGTPASVQLQQGSPLNIQPAQAYMQRPRSSPSSTAISPQNRYPQHQQGAYHQTPPVVDYRSANNRQMNIQQNAYCSRDPVTVGYQHQRNVYSGDMHYSSKPSQQTTGRFNPYARSGTARSAYNHHSVQQFHQQQHQHQYGGVTGHNGYTQAGTYHASYHAR